MKYLSVLFAVVVLSLPFDAQALFIYTTAKSALRDYNRDGTPDEVASYASDYVYNDYGGESRVFVEFDLTSFDGVFDQAILTFRTDNGAQFFFPPYFNNHLQLYSYLGADNSISLNDWNTPKTSVGSLIQLAPYISPNNDSEVFNFEVDVSQVIRDALANGDDYFGIMIANPIFLPTSNGGGLIRVNNFDIFNRVPVPNPSTITIFFLAAIFLFGTRVARAKRASQFK